MNILLASSEAVPFCKTGGLADVVGALAQIFAKAGHRVHLFLPKYRAVQSGPLSLRAVPGSFQIPIGEGLERASLATTSWGAATVCFVDSPKYFSRDGLYGEGGKDYDDNDERFFFFSRAVLEGAKFLDVRPDVIHCHDWQTALIPAYLEAVYHTDAFFAGTGTVLTVHNIAYQGVFPKDSLFVAGFGWSQFTPDRLEYYGSMNFLKAGLVYADLLTTVSPSYAREIQSSADFGRGLEGVLRHRAKDLSGILNGIDLEAWNPETDPHLPRNYGLEDARAGKAACKAKVREELGLRVDPDAPLIGVVSRLDPQKGLDLAIETLPPLLSRGAMLAVIGTGDPALERGFAALESAHLGAVRFRRAFDEPCARRLYAGCDLFLMPSRFEPCGLGQMIAMRYGAVPVVTRTGGLADTVRDGDNGFVADGPTAEALRAALERAFGAYARPEDWSRLVAAGMGEDLSWDRSAREYLELYARVARRPA